MLLQRHKISLSLFFSILASTRKTCFKSRYLMDETFTGFDSQSFIYPTHNPASLCMYAILSFPSVVRFIDQ